MIHMEEKDGKVYIHVLDVNNELEPISWEVVVDQDDFMWCVKQKEKAGAEDPKESAILDFALTGVCAGGEE